MINWFIGILTFILLFVVYQYWKKNILFFRDPKRVSPNDDSLVVSPCDGVVMYVKEIINGEVVCEKLGTRIPISEISKTQDAPKTGKLIGIYMSPFDVHFNYSPINGKVTNVVHTQAKLNLPMVDLWEYIQFCWLRSYVNLLGRKYHLENERNTIFIQGKHKIMMVEIADKVVNKIVCFVKSGESVAQGQKVSFIKRGSQVDLVLPGEGYEVVVHAGVHVKGAVTVIARV